MDPNIHHTTRPVVLIVDDDHVTIRLLERLLHSAGFGTVSATCLAEAQDILQTQEITLLLLDVHLPDGNGLDFCAKIGRDNTLAAIPVLFISANTDEATKVKGFAAGAVDYITKPLSAGEVLARVRTHLRLRMAYEKLARLEAQHIQEIAATQQALMPLPAELPEAHFQVCLREVLGAGGDFYDVFPVGDQTTDYLVADASGHNLGTSLWTASFKALLAEYASVLNTPLEVCHMANNTLMRVLPECAYFTAVFVRLNREFRTLTVINAGHPAPILYSAADGTLRTLDQVGDVLGMFAEPIFGESIVRVHAGDRLYLYTDGLIEMAGPRAAGLARLEEACRATIHLAVEDQVSAIVDRACDGRTPEDDIVLVGIAI